MANLTNAMENDLLDELTGVTTTLSTTMSIALFTADPTDTGSVTNECTNAGYARKLLSGIFSAATGAGGSSSNTSVLDFDTATEDWTELTHIGFMKSDVETTDDMAVWMELESPISILDTKKFSFAIGDLTVTAA